MDEQVASSDSTRNPPNSVPGPHPVWGVLAVAGLAMILAAGLSIAVEWYPLRLRNAFWLFRISGGTLDVVPLLTVGVLFVGAGVIGLRKPLLLRLFAVASIVLILTVAGIYAGFITSIPRVQQLATSSSDTTTILTEVIRVSLGAMIAIILYTWLAWTAWSSAAWARQQTERT